MKDTLKVISGNTKMVAHRGLSGIETENTNAAFVAAANRSYFGIETDVHVTSDGKFLCMHDENTLRTSGIDFNIEENTAESAKNIVHFDKHGTKSRRDLVIPTLSDYITVCRDYGKKAVLEIKNPMSREHIGALVDEIKSLGYVDGTVFISFTMQNLIYAREFAPEAEAQFLCGKCTDEIIEKLVSNRLDLDVQFGYIDSKEKVDMLHSKGIKVNVWTCDSKDACERLASYGVDFITSNICE